MKYILIILLALPTFLFSQNKNDLTISKIFDINQVVIECLSDYEKQSKVSSRNEDDFFMLFTDNEKIIDDVIPSKNYGSKINSVDWVDLMKGVKIYNIDAEILEFESYNPVSIDSGYVIAKVKKTVKTAIWSDNARPEFNIIIGKGDNKVSQRVNYKSEEVYRFKFVYSLKSDDFIFCSINSIEKINELSDINVYVPYIKPIIGKKKLMKSVLSDSIISLYDTLNLLSGDKIKYFIGDQNINISNYSIDEYRLPKTEKTENTTFVNFIYNDKLQINAMYSILISDKASVFDVGLGVQPNLIEYNEKTNISIFSDFYKSDRGIEVGLKLQQISSETNIQLDSYEFISQLENPITNFSSDYTRKNQVTNFSETLNIDQTLLFLNAKYNYKDIITLFGGINLFSNNTVTSQRSGSAKYTGIFDVFNIEIDEPINYEIDGTQNTLNLGYKDWNVSNDIVSEQNIGTIFELGAVYSLPITSFDVDIHLIYKGNTESLFSNSKQQISPNINEFNSFAEFSQKLSFDQRINIGLSLGYKF